MHLKSGEVILIFLIKKGRNPPDISHDLGGGTVAFAGPLLSDYERSE